MPLRHRAGVPELVPRLCPVSLAFAQAGMDFPGAGHALGHAEDGPAGAKKSHGAARALSQKRLLAGVGKVKFGGGFYCGRLEDIFAPVSLLLESGILGSSRRFQGHQRFLHGHARPIPDSWQAVPL